MKSLFVVAIALIAAPAAKEPVSTKDAPTAAGPYSQGIKAGGFVFAAGQIGRDPATNKVEGDVKAQTERTLKNLSAVLTAAGTSLDRAVKVTVFLKNIRRRRAGEAAVPLQAPVFYPESPLPE